jgi:hypothetical protein
MPIEKGYVQLRKRGSAIEVKEAKIGKYLNDGWEKVTFVDKEVDIGNGKKKKVKVPVIEKATSKKALEEKDVLLKQKDAELEEYKKKLAAMNDKK